MTCLSDQEFDETYVDLSSPEIITLTQIDEHGQAHIIILSEKMVEQLIPQLTKWNQMQLSANG